MNVDANQVRPVKFDAELHRSVEQFLFKESRLLDERKWDEWLTLFTEDAMYWVPREHKQTDPHNHISLFWENAMLRKVRVRRLSNPRNWSQRPPTHATRVIGNVMIDEGDLETGEFVVHSTFQMMEWRKREPRLIAGAYTHRLQVNERSFRIQEKRVDLVNCDAVHENFQIFI